MNGPGPTLVRVTTPRIATGPAAIAGYWLDGYNSRYSTVVWMGYPTRRVSMTSVHGEIQQGGKLPSDIWHAYMSAVTAGQPCAPLHESSTGISYQPFYGKYATTGRAESFEPAPSNKGGGGHHGGRPRGGTPAPPPREAPPHGEPPAKEAPETPAQGPGAGQAVEPSGGAGLGK